MHTALLMVELGMAVAFLVLISRALLERADELGLIGSGESFSAGPDQVP